MCSFLCAVYSMYVKNYNILAFAVIFMCIMYLCADILLFKTFAWNNRLSAVYMQFWADYLDGDTYFFAVATRETSSNIGVAFFGSRCQIITNLSSILLLTRFGSLIYQVWYTPSCSLLARS